MAIRVRAVKRRGHAGRNRSGWSFVSNAWTDLTDEDLAALGQVGVAAILADPLLEVREVGGPGEREPDEDEDPDEKGGPGPGLAASSTAGPTGDGHTSGEPMKPAASGPASDRAASPDAGPGGCTGVNATGARCGGKALKGTDRCRAHTEADGEPASAEPPKAKGQREPNAPPAGAQE